MQRISSTVQIYTTAAPCLGNSKYLLYLDRIIYTDSRHVYVVVCSSQLLCRRHRHYYLARRGLIQWSAKLKRGINGCKKSGWKSHCVPIETCTVKDNIVFDIIHLFWQQSIHAETVQHCFRMPTFVAINKDPSIGVHVISRHRSLYGEKQIPWLHKPALRLTFMM